MALTVPNDAQVALDWAWEQYEPFFQHLTQQSLDSTNLENWMQGWSQINDLLHEVFARLSIATTADTTDTVAETRFRTFLSEIFPKAMSADQELKTKLIESGLEPEGFAVQLRDLRAEAELFREANLPLQTEERTLGNDYSRIIGGQTVEWEGEELTLTQLLPIYQRPDRVAREQAWRLASDRQLADRESINTIWQKLYDLRVQMAANADMPDYRSYAWKLRGRFDYSPDDCMRFHEAIEAAVVPAAKRIYERRRERLGLSTLRPWDTEARMPGEPILKPFETIDEFESRAELVFTNVDSELGGQFGIMRREGLLDMPNRKGKGPGAYCSNFPVAGRPFIFMNAVGIGSDVRTLLHEAGHAFHNFATYHLPYNQQRHAPIEFCEVASMAMELLAAPYLRANHGGYYDDADYQRARSEHLEGIILFWPYMAVVDGFQHWAYTNPEAGRDPAECDAAWGRLWNRFMGGVDWSGLEAERVTGWHRKQHIYRYPFYYVEYGLAQLGAVQVWRNSLNDQAGALSAYRHALSLGATATLPDLFTAAGAKFAFDTETMQSAIDLIEEQLGLLV